MLSDSQEESGAKKSYVILSTKSISGAYFFGWCVQQFFSEHFLNG